MIATKAYAAQTAGATLLRLLILKEENQDLTMLKLTFSIVVFVTPIFI